MFHGITRIIIEIRDMLNRSNVGNIINNVGKGMVYGNMVNSIGGGVNIRGAL